jgi:hypothetical protein
MTGAYPGPGLPGQPHHDQLNKDHEGRPNFQAAFHTAYRETRRWVDFFEQTMGQNEFLRELKTLHPRALQPDIQRQFNLAEQLFRATNKWKWTPGR